MSDRKQERCRRKDRKRKEADETRKIKRGQNETGEQQ